MENNELSHAHPLTTSLIKGERVHLTPEVAWSEGTNLKSLSDSAEVKTWLFMEVGKLIKDIDAKKTISTDEEMLFTCRAILEECPTIKCEEIKLVFDYIRMGKFGKLYERLKTAEILDCIRHYEGNQRAEVMERQHHNQKVSYNADANRKLEPLNLAALLDDVEEEPAKEGLGTRLGKRNGWV